MKKLLFWRGDLVAVKVNPELERIEIVVQSADADLWEAGYGEGVFERCVTLNVSKNSLGWTIIVNKKVTGTSVYRRSGSFFVSLRASETIQHYVPYYINDTTIFEIVLSLSHR
ncbi:hypothetical protein M413DRAFT_445871 [Hebeloma cylindrosporum]|uniref:Uncharacterized protein n=1 Tax=Hebeloma cylindrosporum TaxID=76867 RepID=A0A0C3CC48_HEBCY|nr:hypothetical protein M413DRAFT_445871 [Hebeloma cylindrosporum h7]